MEQEIYSPFLYIGLLSEILEDMMKGKKVFLFPSSHSFEKLYALFLSLISQSFQFSKFSKDYSTMVSSPCSLGFRG